MENLSDKNYSTPMMQQYLQIKQKYTDCLLFFRLGDFYELFLEDAKIGAKVLDITLTARDRGSDGKIPMAGVPFHAVDSYLNKLVRAGYKIAICEQLSDPTKPGLVERDVVRIVTPGTILDEKSLNQKENNYIISCYVEKEKTHLAIADLSTGDFFFTTTTLEKLPNELSKINASECVLDVFHYKNLNIVKAIKKQREININCFYEAEEYVENPEKIIKEQFNIKTLQGFGIEKEQNLKAPALLLGYLRHTQKNNIRHITKIKKYKKEKYLELDEATITNLELLRTLKTGEKRGSLINLLDQTSTPMGARLLRDWLIKPLVKKDKIEKRQDAIEYFYKNNGIRAHLDNKLDKIIDIQRLLARISVGLGNPKDLVNLKETLIICLEIKNEYIRYIRKGIKNDIHRIIKIIENTIEEDPPFDAKQGGYIKSNVNQELDKIRNKIKDSKEYILNLEEIERKRTGISTLKVKYNKVFGYYIEVTKANSKNIPNDYFRKQTLVNAERYETEELKKHERIVLQAEEKTKQIEYEVFVGLVENIIDTTKELQNTALAVAKLDCVMCLTKVAIQKGYNKPKITTKETLKLTNSRHPVVEDLIEEKTFVPNSITLDTKKKQLAIITGPNMAGKSVFLRQVAIITLLAQIGSYIPALEAEIGIVDKIFVRSGASDVITSGLSTFMVEMVEAANILNNATTKSLIIMDEVGRGTSTYDGISIAQAIAEYLVSNDKNNNPKTLFATHYHELQKLEYIFPNKVINYQMAVKDDEKQPVFLHKIIKGGAKASYGIEVAKIAGVPHQITKRANEILKDLEQNKSYIANIKLTKEELNKLTPLEALNILNKISNEN